ncbi:MAG: MarR family transcriptional regulator [Anaerolineae bacterium]|nr:MarR family transcriptional regulator [Anaerolineae bacterium]
MGPHKGNTPEHVRRAIAETMGIDDLTLFDILRALGFAHHILEQLGEALVGREDLSAARMHILMRLRVAEKLDHRVSPTELSRYHNVSRNTISALLRGLEDQGLIERTLDSKDRRRFYIRLTEAGRAAVKGRVPGVAMRMADVFADFTPEERATLLALLDKLGIALSGAMNKVLNAGDAHDARPKEQIR